MNRNNDTIYGINGPVVTVKGGVGLAMMDMVHVGDEALIGEVVGVDGDTTTIQVYEDTSGLMPLQSVVSQHAPMSIALGPGLLQNIFDGIARPLRVIEEKSGPFIGRGLNLPTLDETRQWDTTIVVKEGDTLSGGSLYAQCQETSLILHRCLVPAELSGTVTKIVPNGRYTVVDTLVELTDGQGQVHPLRLAQRWPIRTPRPMAQRLPIHRPPHYRSTHYRYTFPYREGWRGRHSGSLWGGKNYDSTPASQMVRR